MKKVFNDKKMKKEKHILPTPESIRYTMSKDEKNLYAIQLVQAADKKCLAKSVTLNNLNGKKIKKVSFLGVDAKVNWHLGDEGLVMQINSQEAPLYCGVWKIETE